MVNTRGRAGSSKPVPAHPVPPAKQNQKQKKPVEEEASDNENTTLPRPIAKPRARTRQNDGEPVPVGEAIEVSAPVNRKRRARSRSVDGDDELGAIALQAQGATITVNRVACKYTTKMRQFREFALIFSLPSFQYPLSRKDLRAPPLLFPKISISENRQLRPIILPHPTCLRVASCW